MSQVQLDQQADHRPADAAHLRAHGWVEGASGWSMSKGFCKPLPLSSAVKLQRLLAELDDEDAG